MVAVLVVFVASVVICSIIAYTLGKLWFSDRYNRRLRSFFFLGIQIFFWTLFSAVVMVINIEYFPFVYTLRFIFVCTTPFAAAWFVFDFTGSPLAKKVWVRNLFIIAAAVNLILVVTNPLHWLYFADYAYPLPTTALIFRVHLVVSIILLLTSFTMLLRFVVKGYKNNPLLIAVSAGVALPYIINLMYAFEVIPFPHDLTPIGFFVSFSLFGLVSFRSQLFNFKTSMFSAAMDSVDDVIIAGNERQIIINANKSAIDLFPDFPIIFGITDFNDFFKHFSGGAQITPDGFDEGAKSGAETAGECVMLKGGSKQIYSLNFRPVYEGKRKSGFIFMMSNVTKYREMMEEKQSRIIAEESNRTKSMFIANMSHEIRTPMNSILGYSELALNDDIPDQTRGRLVNIISNTKLLLGIINDVLDISKIESGNLVLEEIPFDICKLSNQCCSMLTSTAKDKGITLSFSADVPNLTNLPLLGDPTKLSQIFINLLSNAIKFTETGSVTFTAAIESIEQNSCALKFSVADTGIGMTEKQLAHIYAPFMQADSNTARKYGGTGLGLTIAKRLIEAMGGNLQVKSAPSMGSVFSFILTFKPAEQPEGDCPGEAPQVPRPHFNGGDVLVVDDNTMNLSIACEHLRRVGLSTFIAKNGIEAIEIVKGRINNNQPPFALILMDIHMPEMDGKEAAVIISNLGINTPIIAMTADVVYLTADSPYKNFGMKSHLGKPFTAQELWKCLLEFLTPA